MADSSLAVRSIRGVQQSFFPPVRTAQAPSVEPKGVVYTKRWVVDLLLDLAGYTASANLVDAVAIEPSAGEGAFLGPMIERLIGSCEHLCRPIMTCQNSLVAYELDEASAERTRGHAVGLLMKHGINKPEAEKLAEGWIRTGDYLLEAQAGTADFVVGNPPYVRLEDISDDVAQHYRTMYTTMCGRADLYVAFFEAALRQLKGGGACAFICADRWMRNQYGAQLRDLVTSHFSVDVVIEMHSADAFHDEVDAYPAITVIRRNPQGSTIVAKAGPEVGKLSSEGLAALFLGIPGPDSTSMPDGLRAARVESWFKGNSPWPCQSPEQLTLLRRLEEAFPPLEASAKVGIGVATGNDGVFITRDANLVESSRLLKLALVKDIWEGTMKWSGHYLVDPWNGDGLVQLNNYPRMEAYFEQHARALKKRHTAIKSAHAWYKTIDRVTHSLTDKPKLYIADIKNSLVPVLDNGETYPHHNLYFVQSDSWDLEVLGGLLLSAVGQFFIQSYGVKMRGGYLRFQAQYLRRIRVPSPGTLTRIQTQALREAFRARDKQRATDLAFEVYQIDAEDMEKALGH